METEAAISSIAGGALIGAAAVTLMVANGRIAGIAGILGGLFGASTGDIGWRIAFIVGLIAGPFAIAPLAGGIPVVRIDATMPVVVLAGLLVGFGARLGNGCTSGHGVCGLARRSPRSLAATATFMITGAAVVFALRHLAGG
jgi:uncharacterized protein